MGEIVEPYDHDQKFPVFGFGGVMAPNKSVSHCFPVNGNPGDPEVHGIQGVMNLYRQTLPGIKFSGPTYFGPILDAFKSHCKKSVGKPVYNVLLLLTDGTIHDMAETISLVVDLAEFPCSIIIIGVGEANF